MIIEKKYHYFYKTTNKINNKFYYGIRSTDINPINDSYLGSGTLLKRAIEKYGRKSFEKSIIKLFQTREEVNEYEKKIVTEELVNDINCYNIKTGGDNEFIFHCTEETREKRRKSHQGLPKSKQFMENIGFKNAKLQAYRYLPKSDEFKKKVSAKLKGRKMSHDTKIKMSQWQKGKKISQEQKIQISNTLKKYYLTKNNPRLGLTHSLESKIKMSLNNKNKKQCLIENKIFPSIQSVADYYKLSTNSVKDRIRSQRERWNQWNLV